MRSMVFLPGNTPNLVINGEILAADGLILDLEDAVSPDEKDSARILVRNYLKSLQDRSKQIIVRINSTDTEYWKDDLLTVLPMKPDAIMATKVNGAAMVNEISDFMAEVEQKYHMPVGGVGLITLLETAMGVEKAFEIATACGRVCAMLLGAEDLTADLQCKRTKESKEIFYARTRVVCAARAAGIEVYDTPFTDVDDIEGLCEDIQVAKGLGFTGKAIISPRHIEYVNEYFSPSLEEIDYAKRVLQTIEEAKAQGKGVVSLDGKMIDAPIVIRATQVCEAAERIYGGVL